MQIDWGTARNLVTHYTFVAIDSATPLVQIAGIHDHPVSEWMEQIAQNLTDYKDARHRQSVRQRGGTREMWPG